MNNYTLRVILIVSVLQLLFPAGMMAQGVDDKNDLPFDTTSIVTVVSEENWDLFGKQDVVKLSLIFDIKEFLKPRNAGKYHVARLLIHISDSGIIEKAVKIRTRGQFRQEHCMFPPIKLNLKKAKFDNEYLEQQTTFKVVTHCRNTSGYENYILKEYLVYKMYNELTDYSFRVRLIQMQYIDSKGKRKPFVKYGFLIEHLNAMATRNNAIRIDNEKLGMKLMDPEGMARVALFNYMIGNCDWSITGLHNMKVIKIKDFTVQYPQPVPYDFDYSGFVDAEYAVPPENLGLESIRERRYIGICLPETTTASAIRLFLEKKAAMYKVINDFDYLSKKEKKELLRYIDSFFRVLDSDFLIRRDIYSTCIE